MMMMIFCREEAERRAAEERERAKRERRCPECGNKVRVVNDICRKKFGNKEFVFCIVLLLLFSH